MKKKLFAITAAVMMAVAPAMGQIVILDDDEWNHPRATGESPMGVMVLEQDVTYDQYLPLGEGIAVLTVLAGAYLVGKRKKES